MDDVLLASISGMVGSAARIAQGFLALKGFYLALVIMVLATILVSAVGYDAGDFGRGRVFAYIAAWINVNLSAAGGFHLTEESINKMHERRDL